MDVREPRRPRGRRRRTPGASRNGLNPCFVLASTGTRASRPAGARGSRRGRGGCGGSPAASRRISRDEPARRSDGAVAAVQAQLLDRHAAARGAARELRRARLVLVEHDEADVAPALAQRGQQEEQVLLGAGDPGDLRDVEDARAHRASSTTRSRPAVDRVLAHHRLPELPPERVPVEAPRAPRSASASPSASSRSNRSSGREEPVEGGVRGEHGQAGRRRLVDDLVRRARRACC